MVILCVKLYLLYHNQNFLNYDLTFLYHNILIVNCFNSKIFFLYILYMIHHHICVLLQINHLFWKICFIVVIILI